MTNSVDPEQTAPLKGTVCSGYVLFVQTDLSQYLEFLLYMSLSAKKQTTKSASAKVLKTVLSSCII